MLILCVAVNRLFKEKLEPREYIFLKLTNHNNSWGNVVAKVKCSVWVFCRVFFCSVFKCVAQLESFKGLLM